MPQRRPLPRQGEKPTALKDPCEDRPVKNVLPPPAHLLTADVLMDAKGLPDVDVLRRHLDLEGVLAQELLLDLIKKASGLLEQEPNTLKLQDPITVVGDIHGQYFDLVKLFEVGGDPGEVQYLFLGDYVDRGSFSVEVMALLYAIKIRNPKRVRMLRGNHECRQMTSFFNFREECEYKYDITVYNAFMDSFDMLPLSATINGKFLAVHGGLSPELTSLKAIRTGRAERCPPHTDRPRGEAAPVEAINSINRFCEPPREGLLCDLLWSDPLEPKEDEAPAAKPAKKSSTPAFIHNEVRGCSFFFSFEGASKFLQKNSLLSVIRAHEAQLEGYKMHKTNPTTGFPAVITVFSAPNYCDVYNNKGAILKFDNSSLNILQFNCSPHPYHLPNFMDVFTWSMPFVIEKVTEMLYYVLQTPAGEDANDQTLPEDLELPPVSPKVRKHFSTKSVTAEEKSVVEFACQLQARGRPSAGANGGSGSAAGEGAETSPERRAEQADRIRKKVRTIARMARMMKTLRQENETIVQLKGVCPGHKLKPGMLLAGKDQLANELQRFNHAMELDAENELRPEGGPA